METRKIRLSGDRTKLLVGGRAYSIQREPHFCDGQGKKSDGQNGAGYALKLPVSLDPSNGKVKRHTYRGASPEYLLEAVRGSTKLTREQMRLKPERTLEAYFAHWAKETGSHVSRSEREKREKIFREHLAPYFGQVRLEEITEEDVGAWIDQLLREEVAPSTVRRAHAMLRQMLARAAREHYIPCAPRMTRRFPHAPKPQQALSAEQQTYIRQHADGDVLWRMIYLMLSCGLRRGEVLGLMYHDINFRYGYLWVRRQVTESLREGDRVTVYKEVKKTGKIRLVSLSEECVRILKSQREHQLRRMWASTRYNRNSDRLFTDDNGFFIEPQTLSQVFHDRMSNTGPRVHVHSLRRTFVINRYCRDGHRDLPGVLRETGITKATALTYLSENEPGIRFVADAIQKEGEKHPMRKQWEIAFEVPWIEIYENKLCLSEAGVDFFEDAAYLTMENSEDGTMLYLRETEIARDALQLAGYLGTSDGTCREPVVWYSRSIADNLRRLTGDGYNMRDGVRLTGRYHAREKELLFSVDSLVQLPPRTKGKPNAPKGRRGRRKKSAEPGPADTTDAARSGASSQAGADAR